MVEKQQIDIKQISIRQVGAVKTILAKSGFTFENVKEDSTKDGYTTYGTFKTPSAIIVVRLSNHICSMKNWTERYKPKLIAKPKLLRRMGKNIQDPYKERCFFSIVFKAFDYSVNDSGSWKAICNEYVFNPIEVEEGGTIGKIANDAKGLNRGKPSTINGIQPQIREVNNENENLPKATDKIPQNISVDKDGNWVSTNGWGADYVSENKQYNTNRNMKQTIKLRESELRRMIAESIRGTLKESNGNDTIDREWYSQKGAILDDEEEYIARYYNIFEKAYDSARKLYNFLNNTVNVHDIEYLRYQVRNSKDSDIQNAIYEALKAVNNAESKLHNVFYMMKELK